MHPGVLGGLALASLVATSSLAAQSVAAAARHPGRIVGVFDEQTGNPIAAAEVIDLFTGGNAHTEAHGLIELSQFQRRNDSAAVWIRKIGYADTSLVVMVGAADTVPVPVNLRRAAVDLPAIISHATVTTSTLDSRRLAEFDFRRKMGFGYFMVGGELRDYADNHPFGDYLASRFPKLSIATNRQGDQFLARAGSNGQCPVAIYVDGVAVYKPGQSPMVEDFRNYKSDDYVGVEWYSGASTVPTEYGGTGASCGVLLLWRRYH